MMWMVISPMFTMLNKWCFTEGGFPFPVTLTALHMGSCFVVFGAISLLPRGIRAWVLPDVDTPIPCDVYLKGFVPAALLMAVSLGLGNVALLHTSVIFTQLIKPLNVVITSVAAFAWGLEVPTVTHLLTVTIVAGGVCVAAFGGTEFSVIGLLCQLTASAAEGLRLIVLQGVMQTNLKLDPVTTVYRFAPLASLVLCFMSVLLENPLDLSHVHAPGMILMNCISAVILNILIALVIARTSAVVSVLAGVAKDIGTIIVSSYIFGQPLTFTDMLGYGMSLTGICMYKVYKDRLALFINNGFFGGWYQVICSFLVRPESK
jgi:solute carrier family 35 protein C2